MSESPSEMDRVEMADEIRALRDRVDDLERRLDRLESDGSAAADTSQPGVSDHRDAAVVDALEHGQVVNASDLHALYRKRTDICDSDTSRQRVKQLVTNGPFGRVGPGPARWRYTGGEPSE